MEGMKEWRGRKGSIVVGKKGMKGRRGRKEMRQRKGRWPTRKGEIGRKEGDEENEG